MSVIPPRDRLIVALDVPSVGEAEVLVEKLGDSVTFYKVGLQLGFTGGLPFAERLRRSGKRVFLDVKLLDIDNTIAGAVKSIAAMGMTFVTIHGLLGVTVLTSMDDDDLTAAGYAEGIVDTVGRRAAQAREAGMDGIVASPGEAAMVRAIAGPNIAIVTPGIRPEGAELGDQKRTATPAAAIAAGADYLVVGRPITAATDPRAAADEIVREIARAALQP